MSEAIPTMGRSSINLQPIQWVFYTQKTLRYNRFLYLEFIKAFEAFEPMGFEMTEVIPTIVRSSLNL